MSVERSCTAAAVMVNRISALVMVLITQTRWLNALRFGLCYIRWACPRTVARYSPFRFAKIKSEARTHIFLEMKPANEECINQFSQSADNKLNCVIISSVLMILPQY